MNSSHFFDTFSTPLGSFSVSVDDTGAVTATAFGDLDRLKTRLGSLELKPEKSLVRAAREQVSEYFEGNRRDFTLRLAPAGTPFQKSVWHALQRIPFGSTTTYGKLAARLGVPGAARAVGRANATNPICVIIPCHRVIGADGTLTGFAFGEDVKRALLSLERAPVACAAA